MMREHRDFQDPKYKRWRVGVYKRDGFACRMCGNNQRLQAHHIRRWADSPELRFVISNGITLCELCHANVKDKEAEYAAFFMNLIGKPKVSGRGYRDNYIRVRMELRKRCNTQ